MDEVPFSRLFDNCEGSYPPDDEGGMAPDALGRDAMRELTVPVRHEWLTRERAYGKIAIEPFESGFALTVGNAYRRVLLSSVSGAAPTWAKIEGVLHEFSYRPGVLEDTLDILLNLRKLVFTLHVNRPTLLRLKAQGERTVTGRDFEPAADVEILTPDVVLATLDRDGNLEMEVCVERGRGYQPAEKREPEALPINAMRMDADFSPVKRVNFHVESLATPAASQERLILEVWTSGGMTPEAAGRERRGGRAPGAQRSQRAPVRERGRAGPVGAVLQLSEDRQHRHHRRPRAEDRVRAAEDQELRQEVAERDQGHPGGDWALTRHAPGSRGAGAAACLPRAHYRGPAPGMNGRCHVFGRSFAPPRGMMQRRSRGRPG